jgi:NAD(P)H-hydrate epimerase
MGTGGTGDVLTGLIAGRLGQRDLSTFDEVCIAVRAHGLAGDLVAERLGETGLIASDLLDAVPSALRELQEQGASTP